ncbi:MAG: hypothetical protein B6D47_12980 [Rhodocyclaceae bacterium UTPRO2]|nr:MAG: hypothetical protein B6D47_12980 [Rhodocyclaceae bacterium UTPRO2]
MKTIQTNPTWDRVETIKSALGLKSDIEFYRLAGADKGLGGQWKSGQVKTIGAEYAFRLQDKTGFNARWIMLGEGPKRSIAVGEGLYVTDPKVSRIAQTLLQAQEEGKEYIVEATQKDLDTASELAAKAAAHAKAKDC